MEPEPLQNGMEEPVSAACPAVDASMVWLRFLPWSDGPGQLPARSDSSFRTGSERLEPLAWLPRCTHQTASTHEHRQFLFHSIRKTSTRSPPPPTCRCGLGRAWTLRLPSPSAGCARTEGVERIRFRKRGWKLDEARAKRSDASGSGIRIETRTEHDHLPSPSPGAASQTLSANHPPLDPEDGPHGPSVSRSPEGIDAMDGMDSMG